MAYTTWPSTTDTNHPTTTDTNHPTGQTNHPGASDVTNWPNSGAAVASHLLDGSSNILAVTVGVDQLTNA